MWILAVSIVHQIFTLLRGNKNIIKISRYCRKHFGPELRKNTRGEVFEMSCSSGSQSWLHIRVTTGALKMCSAQAMPQPCQFPVTGRNAFSRSAPDGKFEIGVRGAAPPLGQRLGAAGAAWLVAVRLPSAPPSPLSFSSSPVSLFRVSLIKGHLSLDLGPTGENTG